MLMKKLFVICTLALGMLAVPQTVSAQGFLKKIAKGLESVNKSLDNANTKVLVATGEAKIQEDSVVVLNPMHRQFDVELLGAYGVSTSENYGNVELVLKVTMKAPETSIGFGGKTGSQQTIAFDGDGNSYKMANASTWNSFDITEGIPAKIVLNGDYAFQKVHKTEFLPIIKLFTHIAYESGKQGELQFKNVPVHWDVEH